MGSSVHPHCVSEEQALMRRSFSQLIRNIWLYIGGIKVALKSLPKHTQQRFKLWQDVTSDQETGISGVADPCWVVGILHILCAFNVTYSRALILLSVYSGYRNSVNTLRDLSVSSGPLVFTVDSEGGRTQEDSGTTGDMSLSWQRGKRSKHTAGFRTPGWISTLFFLEFVHMIGAP